MTATAWWLIGVAAVVAAVDWVAVMTDRKPVEYVAKPLTMVVLIAAAVALEPVDGAMRAWFIAALALSMVGDTCLMLPGERWFVPGVGAFLLAHLCYVPGFIAGGIDRSLTLIALPMLVFAVAAVGPRVVRAAREADPALAIPISVYIGVISAMVVAAVGSGVAVAIIGAVLFYGSDLTIAWNRFIRPFPAAQIIIMTTYHLAQALLVVSLTVAR